MQLRHVLLRGISSLVDRLLGLVCVALVGVTRRCVRIGFRHALCRALAPPEEESDGTKEKQTANDATNNATDCAT